VTDQPFMSREEADAYIAQQLRGSASVVADALPGGAGSAGPTDADLGAQLAAGGAAAGLLPHEATMDDLMAEFRAMASKMTVLEKELAVTRQAQVAGRAPDDLVLYAHNAADWIGVHKRMNGDIVQALPNHFAAPEAAAKAMADAAVAVTGNGLDGQPTDAGANPAKVSEVRKAAAALERWIEKIHVRESGKAIDFSVVLDDVFRVLEAADKIAA
jgi:hypothetical protein